MATKKTSTRPSPLAPSPKIPEDIAQQLRDMEPIVIQGKKDIAALKKLGLETKSLEDKLDWAEEARKTILSEFT